MSERARLVIFVVGTLLLFTIVALIVQATTDFDYVRDHASDRTNPWGTKAFRELLTRSGVATETWTMPLSRLSEEVQFLIILDPTEPISGDDRDALAAWVADGGRLVVAPYAYRPFEGPEGRQASNSLEATLSAFNVRSTIGDAADEEVSAVAQSPLTADVAQVLVPTDGRLRKAGPGEVLLADGMGAPAAVSVPHGEGRVIVLAEAEMLGNATLPLADNVVFAANLIFAGGAPDAVYFDEYHHGVVAGEGVFGGAEVDVSPFRNTALALLAVAVVYAIGRSRRFGAPVSSRDGSGRSSADYVRALAQIHGRGGAASTAASMLAAGLRRRAASAVGVASTATLGQIANTLDRRGVPGDEVAELLELLESADESMTDAQLLTLARRVAHYERML
ncbi:MAG: DUF4350 domain-containing protein [Armatimonadia bacterium]|nr:DUF4350 domain-containing protein [Armatimonadia bacterium]